LLNAKHQIGVQFQGIEFDGDQMDARTTLAVIDHNLSQNRGQKIDAQGQGVYKTSYSKGT
jgi:hypothetical protein